MRRTRPFAHLLIGSLAVTLVGLEARAAESQPYQPRWHSAEAVYSDSYVSFSSATL